MFLVFESCVHQDAQNLDIVLGLHGLSLDGKGLSVEFVSLGGEVDDRCLLRFKSRSTPSFPVERCIDNCFKTSPVTLRSWSGHPCGKIIHERDRSSLVVNLSLNKVCIEEEEQDWGKGRTLQQSSLW